MYTQIYTMYVYISQYVKILILIIIIQVNTSIFFILDAASSGEL